MHRAYSGLISAGLTFWLNKADLQPDPEDNWKQASKRPPTEEGKANAVFAWAICRAVKSNAVVFAKGGATLAIGGGQTSRVFAVKTAIARAEANGISLQGSSVASDAFFPFRDGLDLCAQAGAVCVIQPGGSIRDQEVIDAADEQDISMLFAQRRHFYH